jgi:hypothetical protein
VLTASSLIQIVIPFPDAFHETWNRQFIVHKHLIEDKIPVALYKYDPKCALISCRDGTVLSVTSFYDDMSAEYETIGMADPFSFIYSYCWFDRKGAC